MAINKRRRDENGPKKENDEGEVAEYEQSRQQRIKENLERMQKLGILELSRNLKPPKTVRPYKRLLPLSGSPRRSSRSFSYSRLLIEMLKTIPVVSYSEKRVPYSKYKLIKDVKIDVKSCHQCRQKTTGLRTTCCKCNLVQGQLCGDCLFMRYGENILKVNAKPDWVCPVCRDICNCSRCRKIKGLEPTGNLYKKALRLGFKSVAHYLVHTRGPHGKQEDIAADETPSSCIEDEVSDDNLVFDQLDNKINCNMDEDSNHVLTEKNIKPHEPNS
ncbi:hypothetical protein L6452_28203 [Arctium lappa]|uniref:Uncharacterized protein n=1 Tax=Arctium lappa TaxID=4217 RepID=A0ACB8ZYM1_ARCLA|nr:hypothetical protein L6452_28203 [Arctium lappa]